MSKIKTVLMSLQLLVVGGLVISGGVLISLSGLVGLDSFPPNKKVEVKSEK